MFQATRLAVLVPVSGGQIAEIGRLEWRSQLDG